MNGNAPHISIITPTYNSAEYLEACILSVARQSYAHKEHLIIDNLSTDGTFEIVRKYADQYPHIRLIAEKDNGIYDAMNKGIERSSGDWLYFLGSDDTLFDEQVLTDIFSSDEAVHHDIIYGNVQWGKTQSVYAGKFSFVKLLDQNICHQAIFFRREVFNRLGTFDLKYEALGDWAFNLKWFGRDDIHKSYQERIIATYNPCGFSSIHHDAFFYTDQENIIATNYPEVFQQLFDQHLTVKKLTGTISNHDEQINALNDQINSLTRDINSLTRDLIERDQQINRMLHSSSWRMTKPIRKITHSVRKRSRKIRDLLRDIKNNRNNFKDLKLPELSQFSTQRSNDSVGYPVVNDYRKGLVTIAIISKNGYELIRPCIEAIEQYCGERDIEILIGDTGTTDKKVLAFYREVQKKKQKPFNNFTIVRFKEYFFSKNYNDLISSYANGEYLVLLNNDTIATPGWLDALIAPLEDKRVGIVGAKLLNRDGTIQHAGIEYNEHGNGYHIFRNEPSDIAAANVPSIVPGVTFACVAMRHDVYDRFQLNEEFREEAQDTDFCQRMHEAGFEILYEPNAELLHFEGSTRDWRKGENDRILLNAKWGNQIRKLALSKHQRKPFLTDAYQGAIVVIRDDGIGDLVMGSSAFRKLRTMYPLRKLVLLTYERNIEMMRGFEIFDEIIPIPNGKKYIPLPVPTKNTTIYNLIDLEMHFGGPFATSKNDNKVHRHVAFTRQFGLDDNYVFEPMPEYSEAKRRVHNMLLDMGGRHDAPLVTFNMMATNPARSWWEPYYPQLIEAVENMGFVPIFIGTKESTYLKGKNAINFIGKTRTVTEYIEALKLGKYVISTDTSACHIAALSGIPFLAIFTGGVLAEARLSYYQKYEVIEPKGLECHPCWDTGCTDHSIRWKKDPCRLMVTPEEVIAKFDALITKYPYSS